MKSHIYRNNWIPDHTPGKPGKGNRAPACDLFDTMTDDSPRIRMTAVDLGPTIQTSVEANGPGADVLYLASELLLSLIGGASEGNPPAAIAALGSITSYCLDRIAEDAGISVDDALQDEEEEEQ